VEEELEEMKEYGMTEKEIQGMIEFETSNRVPYLLIKRYLGENILAMETDIVKLTMYTL